MTQFGEMSGCVFLLTWRGSPGLLPTPFPSPYRGGSLGGLGWGCAFRPVLPPPGSHVKGNVPEPTYLGPHIESVLTLTMNLIQ